MAVHAPVRPTSPARPSVPSSRHDQLLAALQSSEALAVAQHRPHPPTLQPLLSQTGFSQLCQSEGLANFENLTRAFVGQGPLQCGLTSLAILLNAQATGRGEQHSAHQLQEELRRLINPRCAFGRYFSSTIDEIGTLAKRHHGRVIVRKADRCQLDQFRLEAVRTLEAGGGVIVNFERRLVGYESHFAGHMSPLAAYHRATDSFLVYDVAVKTWQPVWIPASLLFEGMDTTDKPRDASCAPSSRGYILIQSDSYSGPKNIELQY